MADFDSTLSRYISRVHTYSQLSRESEVELLKRWREQGDEAARSELVNAHLRYVVAIALKYRRYGVRVDELISEGNFGLVHALSKFELERGTRFVTYAAYWIRAYVLNHIIRSWSMVGVGSGALRSKMFFKLRRERVKILNRVGDGAEADALLARSMNLPEGKVVSMVRRLEARDVSLDSKVFDDSAMTLADTLPSGDPSQEEDLAESELDGYLRDAVRRAVTLLDKRERYIVERRLMADGDDELSLAEIGRRLGVSRERARQLEARAKRKLKSRLEELSQRNGSWLDVMTAA